MFTDTFQSFINEALNEKLVVDYEIKNFAHYDILDEAKLLAEIQKYEMSTKSSCLIVPWKGNTQAQNSPVSATATTLSNSIELPKFIPSLLDDLLNYLSLGLIVVYCDEQLQPLKNTGVSHFIYELAGEAIDAVTQSILIENNTTRIPLGQAYFTHSGDLAQAIGLFHVPCSVSDLDFETLKSSYANCLFECELRNVNEITFTFLNDPELAKKQLNALEEAAVAFFGTTDTCKIEQVFLVFDESLPELAFDLEDTIRNKLGRKYLIKFLAIFSFSNVNFIASSRKNK